MAKAYDVPAADLIARLADELRSEGVERPEWAPFVKTGVHADCPPHDRDWWYVRCASVLRKIYLNGPIGVGELRSTYGGSRPPAGGYGRARHRRAGGAIVRSAVRALEKLGYVEQRGKKGRMASSAGSKKVDRAATEILKKMAERDPALRAYL